MNLNHVMIDIETLGSDVDSLVLSLGGVRFDPYAENNDNMYKMDGIAQPVYYNLNIEEQVATRSINKDTVAWWDTMTPQVREAAFDQTNAVEVEDFLRQLSEWCEGASFYWSQGSFDYVILEDLYKQYNMNPPWHFAEIMDARTISRTMTFDYRKSVDFDLHNALDDAVVQSLCVQYFTSVFKPNWTRRLRHPLRVDQRTL